MYFPEPFPCNLEDGTVTKLLRLPEVIERTAMSRSAIYAEMERGNFPRPVKLLGARANAWAENEISEWIASRLADREAA